MQSINVRRIATNFTLLASGEVVSKVFTLIAFTLLARRLGPTTFGSIEFALALIALFTLIVEGGFSPYGAREVAKYPSRVSWLVSHIVAIRCILAVSGFIVLLGLVAMLSVPLAVKQIVLLYGLTLFFVPVLLPWVFQGLDRMGVVTATTTIRWMVLAGGVFLWVREPAEAWRVPVVEIGAIMLSATFNLWMYRRRYAAVRPRLEANVSLALFREALPIGLSQLLWAARVYLPIIFLGLLVGESSVGWFGTAQRLVLALNTFGVLYLFNLLPSLSRAAKQPRETVQEIMRTSIPIAAWSTVFVSALGMAVAEPLMTMVFGAQYAEGVVSLRILIWLVPAAILTGHFRYTLVAHNAQRLDLRCGALGLGMCLLLTVLLVPTWGPSGAASAILASELFTFAAAYFFVHHRIVTIPVGRHLAGPLLAGSVMVVMVHALPSPSLWLGSTAGILLYAIALVTLQPKMLTDLRSALARDSI
jgi:O-antigen/teichoic acid export membrane protein